VRERHFGLRDVARLRSLNIDIAGEKHSCPIKSGFIPGSKVQVYFLNNKELYNRDGCYSDSKTGEDWTDNHLRFAFLNHASLQLMLHLQWYPDIIHCNDWQTALVPYLVCNNEHYRNAFQNARTILHIHNIDQLGLFSVENALQIGFKPEDFKSGRPPEFEKQLSFLKSGLLFADKLLFLNHVYTRNILAAEETDNKVKGVISARNDYIHTISTGIDTKTWNTATDEHLFKKYMKENFIDLRRKNKDDLQLKLNLSSDIDIPIVSVFPPSDQRGIELIIKSIDLLSAQWIFLCDSDDSFQTLTNDIAKTRSNVAVVKIRENEKLEHLIFAGADISLLASSSEQCITNSMINLTYGVVPVVCKVEKIENIVIDTDENPVDGNGFTFDDFSANSMTKALKRALEFYHNHEVWQSLQLRGIRSDFSWKRSVKKLVEIYDEALARPKYCQD